MNTFNTPHHRADWPTRQPISDAIYTQHAINERTAETHDPVLNNYSMADEIYRENMPTFSAANMYATGGNQVEGSTTALN